MWSLGYELCYGTVHADLKSQQFFDSSTDYFYKSSALFGHNNILNCIMSRNKVKKNLCNIFDEVASHGADRFPAYRL